MGNTAKGFVGGCQNEAASVLGIFGIGENRIMDIAF